MLGTMVANILIYYYFSEKIRLGISCELFARQSKCHLLGSQNIICYTVMISMSSIKFITSMIITTEDNISHFETV